MLVFVDKFEFTADVVINVPTKDGFKKHTVKATFEHCPDDVLEALLSGHDDKAALRAVVRNIEGIADAEGKPVTFTAERLETWLNIGYFRTALIRGFMAANAGIERGN